MFGKHLVAIAAAVALAIGTLPADGAHHKSTHIKLVLRGGSPCSGDGESPMSVEGVEGVFCVSGQACVADIADGACPGPQKGLPFGAKCGKVKTGVYGCQPKTEGEDSGDDAECGDGESPMSVEGVEGVFCVSGQACVADIADGACPGPQDGLPNGAYCGKVKTGVYGCKPNGEGGDDEGGDDDTPAPAPAPEEDDDEEGGDDATPAPAPAPEDEDEEEGGDDDTPAPTPLPEEEDEEDEEEDDATVAPAPATEEEEGDSSDDESDDKRRKHKAAPKKKHQHQHKRRRAPASRSKTAPCSDDQSPMSVEGATEIFCVAKGKECVDKRQGGECPGVQENLPFGSMCTQVRPGVYGCRKNKGYKVHKKTHGAHAKKRAPCGNDESEMSVEGVEGVFCVRGQSCVADKYGSCPDAQDGLPHGAYCGTVKSGVFGCKPKGSRKYKKTTVRVKNPTGHHGKGAGCADDEKEVSVEGVGTFCAEKDICAGVMGNCPGPQYGLEYGSYCGKVKTGVLGCKPNRS